MERAPRPPDPLACCKRWASWWVVQSQQPKQVGHSLKALCAGWLVVTVWLALRAGQVGGHSCLGEGHRCCWEQSHTPAGGLPTSVVSHLGVINKREGAALCVSCTGWATQYGVFLLFLTPSLSLLAGLQAVAGWPAVAAVAGSSPGAAASAAGGQPRWAGSALGKSAAGRCGGVCRCRAQLPAAPSTGAGAGW